MSRNSDYTFVELKTDANKVLKTKNGYAIFSFGITHRLDLERAKSRDLRLIKVPTASTSLSQHWLSKVEAIQTR
ncbi:MAG: hypothetical protein M1G31_26070 [Pseudanabaena sp. Salubria-1]|nr:hypothetical protein [Pseudanabaena sp. Salubria-1]